MAAEQQGTDRQSQPVTAACRAGLLLLRTAARQQQGLARAARATTVPRSAAAPSSARHAVVPGT
eukprot:COSAG01_NODE_72851_length_251_cov_148.210526_1_plen_63_part_01